MCPTVWTVPTNVHRQRSQSKNVPPTAPPTASRITYGWSNNVQTLSPHSDTLSKELLSPNSPTKKKSDGPIEHVFLTPGNHIQHQHPISQLTNSYGLMNIDEVDTNAANQVMINSSNDSIRTAVVNIGDIGTFKFEGEDHDVMVILENILPMVKFLDGSILPFDADLQGTFDIIDENSKHWMINSSWFSQLSRLEHIIEKIGFVKWRNFYWPINPLYPCMQTGLINLLLPQSVFLH